MFGFRRRSRADAAVAVLDQAISFAAEEWRRFSDQLAFRPDVSLRDRIGTFGVAFAEGAQARFPALRQAPDAVILLIVAKGVERSTTHTREEIEAALGVELPQ